MSQYTHKATGSDAIRLAASASSLSLSQSHVRLIAFSLKAALYAFLRLFSMLRVCTNDRFTIICHTISLDHCELFVNCIGLMLRGKMLLAA